jgi:hypothetical protein
VADGLNAKLAAAAAAADRSQTKTEQNILDAFDYQLAEQTRKALTAARAELPAGLAAML